MLFCNQNFADYPMQVPDRAFDPWTEASPGWMLLSHRAVAIASSSADGHDPALATDESVRTWWVAGTDQPGEWLQLDLGAETTVHALQVNLADHGLASRAPKRRDLAKATFGKRAVFPDPQPTEVRIELSLDGVEWAVVHDTIGTREDAPHAFVVLPEARRARYIRVTAGAMPFGGAFAVSGLRVFGLADVPLPGVADVGGERRDPRTASLRWEAVPGVVGYNVRYGLSPDKLYHSWLVYDRTDLEVGSLNAGHPYWFAVDSFNRAGVTPGAVACLH